MAVSPDGRFALSAGRNHVIKVWDLEAGTEARPLEGHSGPVQTVAISRDGRFALSGSDDKTITALGLRDPGGKTVLARPCGRRADRRARARRPPCRFGQPRRDGPTLGPGDRHEIRRYKGNTDSVYCAAVSPDGRRIAAGGRDTVIRIWDLESGELLRTLPGSLVGHVAGVLPRWPPAPLRRLELGRQALGCGKR